MSSSKHARLGQFYKTDDKDNLNIVIVGASGGIGQAIVQHLLSETRVDKIYCCSRSTHEMSSNKKIIPIAIDLLDESSISSAAAQVAHDKKAIDLVIVCTGILHDDTLKPEKALKELDAENFLKVMQINALGPALVGKYFMPLLSNVNRCFFGVISARVGSISDNQLGGWHSYRTSKAALNMLIKNIAIEYKRKKSKLIVAGLHPGTVDTSLSLPFQKNVKPEKLFTSEFSADRLLSVINQLNVDDSGCCFAWDGKLIPA